MGDISQYWKNKEMRSKRAYTHTNEMDTKYWREISNCLSGTSVYSPTFGIHSQPREADNPVPEMILEPIDSVSAILKYTEGQTAVLNFASFKNPGGGFLKGSSAQEESLCHESFLYNILRKEIEYYAWNNAHKNYCLYDNRALYSPNVIFERGNVSATCAVITCAAPNYGTIQKYNYPITSKQNEEALQSRIKFILDIAEQQKNETLILGAFGCGVFGQNPTFVAKTFKDYILQNNYHFKKVIFAVPSGLHPENYNAFKAIIGG